MRKMRGIDEGKRRRPGSASRASRWLWTLIQDFADRGAAAARGGRLSVADQAASFGAGIAVLVGFFEGLQGTLSELLGFSGPPLRLLLAAGAFLGCLYLVCSKVVPAARSGSSRREASYRFPGPLRQFAKVGALLLLFIFPWNARAWVRHQERLPNLFAGRLTDMSEGGPVIGAAVGLLGPNGEEIARTPWPTDDDGVYLMKLQKPILRRLATIVIHRSECDVAHVPATRGDFDREGLPDGATGAAPVLRQPVRCEPPP